MVRSRQNVVDFPTVSLTSPSWWTWNDVAYANTPGLCDKEKALWYKRPSLPQAAAIANKCGHSLEEISSSSSLPPTASDLHFLKG